MIDVTNITAALEQLGEAARTWSDRVEKGFAWIRRWDEELWQERRAKEGARRAKLQKQQARRRRNRRNRRKK